MSFLSKAVSSCFLCLTCDCVSAFPLPRIPLVWSSHLYFLPSYWLIRILLNQYKWQILTIYKNIIPQQTREYIANSTYNCYSKLTHENITLFPESNFKYWYWKCSPVKELLASMIESLGSIPGTMKKKADTLWKVDRLCLFEIEVVQKNWVYMVTMYREDRKPWLYIEKETQSERKVTYAGSFLIQTTAAARSSEWPLSPLPYSVGQKQDTDSSHTQW